MGILFELVWRKPSEKAGGMPAFRSGLEAGQPAQQCSDSSWLVPDSGKANGIPDTGLAFADWTIPLVAAFVGWFTNWVSVQMLFYPIEYVGIDLYRKKHVPYGLIGWQGVVPTKADVMAARLTDIVTAKLLSLPEAFSRLDAPHFASLILPSIEESIRNEAPNGAAWALLLKPLLHWALCRVVRALQRDISQVLDLEEVVTDAFLRDVQVLVELFQRVGRRELDFLVISGLYFGFVLGLAQMWIWAHVPRAWTLPVAGAVVGYVTNWVAVKLIFEPVEPVMVGPFLLQGMFEMRQPEVSVEFAEFIAKRVLTPSRVLEGLCDGRRQNEFAALVRANVPVVPDSVVAAALSGLRNLAKEPPSHAAHVYAADALGIEATLAHRLQLLSPKEFEGLLHPVFQEDEIILILAGGVLGVAAGLVQLFFGWGGPSALPAAGMTSLSGM
ncbi:hypothetical protein AK812_SmicGene10956 [Symbiodinium microadriaticum]|uniref:Uncharacterized protein n=1 Tax=Symbiodinium microadriaticum TaxID=2951 RepID=A0A1Q9EEH7_SYMMI|nr:hypothetical protein AK812_SmicGene10956 [Symbiodinium microadriaticum]CAE7261189.1 unnamed protein product [Symbiodinium microadriaticum]CAE7267884.1 unnamed protein product [Symbiodinium sp. KB8]